MHQLPVHHFWLIHTLICLWICCMTRDNLALSLENYVNDLRQELTLTKQKVRKNNQNCLNIWKLCPIYSVTKLQNKTQHLELELRKTNIKVSSLTNDGTSRKQDCIALLNKVQFIEQKTGTLTVRHNDTPAVLQEELHNMNHSCMFINIVFAVSWYVCFCISLRCAFLTKSNVITSFWQSKW
jgi:hypothetical protein